MGYYTSSDNTRVYFQNGLNKNISDHMVSSALLSKFLDEPVEAIVHDQLGLLSYIKECLSIPFSTKDTLNEQIYRSLNSRGKPTLIVLHGYGNKDAYKALKAGQFNGYRYPNLSFLSVGSPVNSDELKLAIQQTGASYLGPIANWRDPMAHFKVVIALLLGFTGVTAWTGMLIGASMAEREGSIEELFYGFLGGDVGALCGILFGAIPGILMQSKYHTFAQYLENRQLQKLVLDWKTVAKK